MKLPRYTYQRYTPKGVRTFRFNPPSQLIDSGIVSRRELGQNYNVAKNIANDLNKLIDEYRQEKLTELSVTRSTTLSELCDIYLLSNDFNALRDSTKADYIYFIRILCLDLGDKKWHTISSRLAKRTYELWVKRGVSLANHVCSVASRVYNYATEMEYGNHNPFSAIRRKAPQPRRIVWAKEQVRQFLNFAYNNYEYRSIGLIVHMAYEWCQRIGDMRLLMWDNIDLDKGQLHLEQSKRRSRVFLPIGDELYEMLLQQKADFGFQQYVAPSIKPVQGKYNPYSLEGVSKIGRRAMKQSGLPDELRLMDLRRTGVTEMIDSGVPMGQLMSVTGHTNVQSVKPYMKHTFESAKNALNTRNKYNV
tara:strand:+ start:1183 stop:2268 length:1086 start_codon:yes stop_codon:yes gene_type:complete